MRLRDRLLPLVRLEEVLQRRRPLDDRTRAEVTRRYQGEHAEEAAKPKFLAVVKAGTQRYGLIVDQILNPEEVVVKPMHSALKSLACFSGATILGDGRVALIVNTDGLARHASVRFETGVPPVIETPIEEGMAEWQTVLLFKYGPNEQF